MQIQVIMSIRLELIDDFRIPPPTRVAIRQLLATCFPEAAFVQIRTYLKQLPPRRLLAWDDAACASASEDGAELIGQLGLEHRVVRVGDEVFPIFGAIEVCVAPHRRRQGVAGAMLDYIDDLARTCGVEFIVLFTDDGRLYRRHGYANRSNLIRWLMIHEHRIIGIDEQPLAELMVKPLGDRAWPDGLFDMLGYQF